MSSFLLKTNVDSGGTTSFFQLAENVIPVECVMTLLFPTKEILLRILLVLGLGMVFEKKTPCFFDLLMSVGRSLQANERRTSLFYTIAEETFENLCAF